MVWTKKDYPDSLKNLEEKIREKAIEIANAMIRDGEKEDKAIPIAITKAKEWAKNSSHENTN